MKQFLLAVLLILFLSCNKKPEVFTQKIISPPPLASSSPTPIGEKQEEIQKGNDEKSADDFVTKDDRQSYGGYEIFKEKRNVVLKKGNKTVATFPGMIDPHSGIDFGLFSFLDNGRKQLIVSATEFRGGEQWIAELSPKYREIFSTVKWGVGREGADLGFIDFDKDGVYEISTGDFWYYTFSDISMSETPVVHVIFAYDKQAGRYVPANHKFKKYSLKGLDEEIKSLPANEGYGYLGGRVDVLLSYVYAGQEKEGWAFFERSYQAKDKAVIKRIIKNTLKNSRVYRYIQAHSQH